GGHQDELTRRGLGGLRRPVAEQFLEDLALRVVERPLHVREMEELCLQALHFRSHLLHGCEQLLFPKGRDGWGTAEDLHGTAGFFPRSAQGGKREGPEARMVPQRPNRSATQTNERAA